MRKNLRFNYSLLILLSIPAFLAGMFIFRSSSGNQFRVMLALTLLYLGGAVLHHFQDKSLTLELIIEYVLIAGLVLLILQGFLM